MVLGRSGRLLATIASFGATLGSALIASPAPEARASCRVAELQFHPVPELQIAIWIEDAAGHYVDTLYVTRATASLGLGNRPGREDFNSEILWPYGRRENALPVWAHRRGVVYPRVVFQDEDDNDLSHAISESSVDPYYCRPLRAGEDAWQATIDSGSCATTAFTDKGMLSPTMTSLYPPRSDLAVRGGSDHVDIMRYGAMNDLDAVSRATPSGDQAVSVRWAMPMTLPAGDYVAWVEVSRESDFNASYNPESYPSPVGLAWAEYGHPYRGQPSLVWKLPFSVGDAATSAVTASYAGYGDPDGLDGVLNPPDGTITTVAGTFDVPAGPNGNPPARTTQDLGAARLEVEASPDGPYQVRVSFRPDNDAIAPGAPGGLTVASHSATDATVEFAAPGDDGNQGTAQAYEIRYGVGPVPSDEAGFVHGRELADPVEPATSSSTQAFRLDALQPNTVYWVGVRAQDDCLNAGPVSYASFTTARIESLPVDACFVATAAWGTREEAHVQLLRGFRDRVLRRSILGELFVETYYTFGPALAEVIRPSDALRQLARDGLSPILSVARSTDPGVSTR
jgi:hypothetical protein